MFFLGFVEPFNEIVNVCMRLKKVFFLIVAIIIIICHFMEILCQHH